MNSKLRLVGLGLVLALPIVAGAWYLRSRVLSGAAGAIPDWLVFSSLAYLPLSIAVLLDGARKLGVYRAPQPSAWRPEQVETLKTHSRRVAARLIFVWFGGFLYTIYEGYRGEIGRVDAIFGACLFLVPVALTGWLMHRDKRPAGPFTSVVPRAGTESVISILFFAGLLLFLVYAATESRSFVFIAFALVPLLLGLVIIHSWSALSARRLRFAPGQPPPSQVSGTSGTVPKDASDGPVDAESGTEAERQRIVWTPLGPIPDTSRLDRTLVYLLLLLMLLLLWLRTF